MPVNQALGPFTMGLSKEIKTTSLHYTIHLYLLTIGVKRGEGGQVLQRDFLGGSVLKIKSLHAQYMKFGVDSISKAVPLSNLINAVL